MLRKWFLRFKIAFYLLSLTALLIAIFENTTPTPIYFLSYEVVLPLSLWLIITFLLGGLIVLSLCLFGWFPSIWRKNKPKKKTIVVDQSKGVASTLRRTKILRFAGY